MKPPPVTRRTWIASGASVFGLVPKSAADHCPEGEFQGKARSLLDPAVARGELAGIVALVTRGSCRPAAVAVGWQDMEWQIGMSEHSIFDIRSITKPVTALGALLLVERNRLDLDAPITESVQEARSSKWAHRVTMRHLLTHTSGLDHERPAGLDGLTESRHIPLGDVARAVLAKPLAGETGTWRYSSPGYCLAGWIIERVARKSFATFLEGEVLRPLRLRNTSFLPPQDARQRVASFYQWKAGKLAPWPLRLPDTHWTYDSPDFGLYSTAADLARLLILISSDEFPLFPPRLRKVMLTPQAATDVRGLGQGLGWMIAQTDEPRGPLGIRTHCFGHNGAGGSMAWANPVTGTAAVFLTQCLFTSSSTGPQFMRMAFGG